MTTSITNEGNQDVKVDVVVDGRGETVTLGPGESKAWHPPPENIYVSPTYGVHDAQVGKLLKRLFAEVSRR